MSGALRFLALGDSYTIGESVPPEEGWPYQLVRLAAGRGIRIAEPHIVAKTGWTTDELIEAIAATPIHGPFDLVSLLVGVNNLYRNRPVEEFRTGFEALLTLAVQFADGKPGRVRVLSIPDWGATPFAEGNDREEIRRTTDRFNAVCREEASRSGAHYIDVTESSRKGLKEPAMLTTDKLHPSGRMYHGWAAAVLSSVIAHDNSTG